MSTVSSEKPAAFLADKPSVVARWAFLRSWLLCWEIYLIVFVAAFLRLYQFNTTEFETDEANYFQIARYAVTHGFIPATSNLASIGYYNPPASVDIFMLPAAFTNDPLWVAMSVAILMTGSVLLTYVFVRCYYGRVAATIAALMYATLFRTVIYSRSIWNTNLLPLFVVLFMMALFWGVVARRKGWLFPALFLLGLLIQLHATGALMIISLGMAVLLAPGTIRWRDLGLGLFSLFILYFPYLLWEISSRFYDLSVLGLVFLHPQQRAVVDNQAWLLYQTLFNPYDILSRQHPFHWLKNIVPYLDESSILWRLAPYLAWVSKLLIYLVVICMVIILGLAVWSWGSSDTNINGDIEASTDGNSQKKGYDELNDRSLVVERGYSWSAWERIRSYWLCLRNSPYRCGLVVLLCWQVIPLIILSRHSLPLYQHYFLFLIPGPFILVGIVLATTTQWLRNPRKMVIPEYLQRYGSYIIVASLIIAAQFIGRVLDTGNGYYSTMLIHRPLWQVVVVSLVMTVSVLLIYGFVYRYYGQFAAILAALIYADLFQTLLYSLQQWNSDLLPFFAVLFVVTLSWGIVARGKGWLFPALFLLGILIQLDPAVALVIIPLGIVLRFVPGTIRWRDFALGLFSIWMVYLPNLLANVSLVIASMVTTLGLLFWSWNSSHIYVNSKAGKIPTEGSSQRKHDGWADSSTSPRTAYSWYSWSHLRKFISHCGPLLLLCWNWVPLTILLHHSISISQQYLLFFLLPACCVLTGIFLGKTVEWLRCNERKALSRYLRRYGIYALAGLIIIAQFIGSTAGIMDINLGHYSNGLTMPPFPAYDLRSLHTAVTQADQLAQRDHLSRVYISTDWTTQDQLQLLSTQMHTPVTLFDSSCVPFPSVAEGPAVMLVGPYDYWVHDMVAQFTMATLKSVIGKSLLFGGTPFSLYVITPKPEQTIPHAQLSLNRNGLQNGISGQYYAGLSWLITRWNIVHSASPAYRTEYVYTMRQVSPFSSSQHPIIQCRFTAMRAGDQVLIPFDQGTLPKGKHESSSLTISVEEIYEEVKPIYLHYGPLTFLTFATTGPISL